MTLTIDDFTDTELAAMAQVDIASIISGETPATATTPVLAWDVENDRTIVVTVLDLGLRMLESHHMGGTPADTVVSQRALDLLAAVGYTTCTRRKRPTRNRRSAP